MIIMKQASTHHIDAPCTGVPLLTTTYSLLHLIVDALFVIVLIIIALILEFGGLQPRELGFFCSDNTIRYPFNRQTINTRSLIAFVSAPVLLIVLVLLYEQLAVRWREKRVHTITERKPLVIKLNLYFKTFEIPILIWKLLLILYSFITGIVITLMVTSSLKLAVGNLRPHFLAACKPNFSLFDCKDDNGYDIFITNYTCTGSFSDIRESRLSFPSGHASFIIYIMTFLVLFLETKPFLPRGLRSGLSLLFAMCGALICVSRFFDYYHHVTDILGGTVIGFITALFAYFYHLRLNAVENINQTSNSPSVACIKIAPREEDVNDIEISGNTHSKHL